MKELDNDKFSVFIPFEIEKSGDGVDKYQNMRFKGVASNAAVGRDSDGELIEVSGMDVRELVSVGNVNFHHLWQNKPSAIIGEPVFAEKRGDELYVEGKLYPNSPMAREVYDLAEVLEKDSETRRLGFSIEGKATLRNPKDKKHILKSRILNIAITPSPKCKGTKMELVKGWGADVDYEPLTDSDFLIDTTDSNGIRRTVDRNFEIKVWDNDLEKGGPGSGRHRSFDHAKVAKIVDPGNFTKQSLAKKAGVSEDMVTEEDVHKVELHYLKTHGKKREEITNPKYKKEHIDEVFSKAQNVDLTKGGPGSGRRKGRTFTHPTSKAKLKVIEPAQQDTHHWVEVTDGKHKGYNEGEQFLMSNSKIDKHLEKAMIAGDITGRDTTGQDLTQQPLKQESVAGVKNKKKKKEKSIKDLTKGEAIVSLMDEGYDGESAKLIYELASEISELVKGGEGSRGGKVIGHTKSGKAIYADRKANSYKSFSKEDHKDAHDIHNKEAKRLHPYTLGKTGHDKKVDIALDQLHHHSAMADDHLAEFDTL